MYKSLGLCEVRVLCQAPTGEALCLRTCDRGKRVLLISTDLMIHDIPMLLPVSHRIVSIDIKCSEFYNSDMMHVRWDYGNTTLGIPTRAVCADRKVVAKGNSVYSIPNSLRGVFELAPHIKHKMVHTMMILRSWLLDELRHAIMMLCCEIQTLDYDTYCVKVETLTEYV